MNDSIKAAIIQKTVRRFIWKFMLQGWYLGPAGRLLQQRWARFERSLQLPTMLCNAPAMPLGKRQHLPRKPYPEAMPQLGY